MSPVLLLLLALFSNVVHADLIDELCSSVEDSPICLNGLRSDPRSKGADLRGLALIAVDKSQDAFRAAIPLVKQLAKGKYKDAAKQCIAVYVDAISILSACRNSLKSGKYSDAILYADGAGTDISLCDLKGQGTSPLLEEVAKQSIFVSVIDVAASRASQQYQ